MMATIQCLPREILIKILSYYVEIEGVIGLLGKISKVCTEWSDAAKDRSLWRVVDFSNAICSISGRQFIELCETHQLACTKKISLSGIKNSGPSNYFMVFPKSCPNLNSINLGYCSNITSESLQVLAENCPFLSEINISGIRKEGARSLSVNCLKYLMCKSGKNLTHLNISDNRIVDFTSVVKLIAENCPNLQEFSASNIDSASPRFPLETFQCKCPNLRALYLTNSQVALPNEKIKNSPGFPELEIISVAGQLNISNKELEKYLKSSVKLKYLDLRHCLSISVSNLLAIPAVDLQHILLSRCKLSYPEELELVLAKWKHSLKEIDLSWTLKCTLQWDLTEGINVLINDNPSTTLESLDLCGSPVTKNTVKKLLNILSLKSLNLQSCRSLPRGLKQSFTGARLNTLRVNLLKETVEENLFKNL